MRASDLVDREGFANGRLLVPVVQEWISQGWVGEQYPEATVGEYEEDFVFNEDAPIGDYVSGGLALWPALARWVFPRLSSAVMDRVRQFQPGTGEYSNFIYVWALTPDPALEGRTYFDVPALEEIPDVAAELRALDDVEVSNVELHEFLDETFPRRSDAWVAAHYEFAGQMWLSHDPALCPPEWRQRYGLSGPARYWTDRAADVLDDAGLLRLAEATLEYQRAMSAEDPQMTRDWFAADVLEGLIEAARTSGG